MRTSTKLLLLLLIAGLAPQAFAQAPGNCRTGTAQAFLNVNDVLASHFNTGGLFFGGSTTSGDGYLVPKASGHSPIFASGVWVGGTVNGERRVAAARYGNYNFWPGPLGDDGRPVDPNDCAQFDRIYNVSRQDIANYEAGLAPARDLADWPVDLGAPVVDGDGDPTNYSLAGGDRPQIIGDQALWWVMNDVGNEHPAAGSTAPIGIEVQVLAWAFSRADALGQTTFYRYRIINKGPNPVENTFISIFSDPDLGDAGDDYVGIDTTLSLGYVYNDNEEDAVYGIPPAAGYDFFQGPIVDGDTLGATSFTTFINGGPAGTTDPGTAEEYYNYMQGLWGDGTPITAFGQGYQTAGDVTKFVYPGNPVTEEFWSEVNIDGSGTNSTSGDRRLVVSTGPFTLQRNEPQDIVFGVVFAQGSGWLNSIDALRAADVLAQTAYDVNFELAPPPPPPPRCNPNSPNAQLQPGSGNCLEAVELDGKATLVWGYPTSSDNYLGGFEVIDALLIGQGAADSTYNFEGFNIYRYPTSGFAVDQRELIATYDIINGVTTVIDQVNDPDVGGLVPEVVARGSDSGIQYSIDLPNLTNNTDYFYGITAYSYNEESTPKVIESAATQIVVRPSRLTRGDLAQSGFGDALDVEVVSQIGQGGVAARVVDPTQVTGDTYEVRFYRPLDQDGNETVFTTYDVVNTTTGEVVLSGQEFYDNTGNALPQGENVTVVDGFTFDILGPEPDFLSFQTISNANGPIDPPTGFAADYQGFPTVPNWRADAGAQQVGPAIWFIDAGGGTGSYDSFKSRVVRGNNADFLYPYDYEWRFTGGTSLGAKDGIFGQSGANPTLPFELWNIGIASPDDPSDDFKMIPIFLDIDDNGEFGFAELDSPISSSDDDPTTDWIYWYTPLDESPGTAGYDAYENGGNADYGQINHEVMGRTRLTAWNLGSAPPYGQDLPEDGTIFRILTTKPNQPGDVFAISTGGAEVLASGIESPEEALDRIAVVPNPYMGSSSYESGNLSRVARFTNLPPEATTIEIYTVSGALVRTLRKEGPSRSLDWDLQTQGNLPVASGMYLIRVNVEGVGERVLKFGVVNRQTQITLF